MQRENNTPPSWLTAVALVVATAGCGGYGEISPDAFQYAQAIYNIANRKAEDRVEPFRQQVQAAADAGEITAQEADWLQAIADDARRGDWPAASQAARQLMEDQVQRLN